MLTRMQRMRPASAAVGAVVAAVVAAAINAALTAIAGDVLQIPGELGVAQVVMFTIVMAVPAAIVLWLVPRHFPWIVIAVAVLTLPFPFMEFDSAVARWLAAMHLVAGVTAALVAPRVAAGMHARSA